MRVGAAEPERGDTCPTWIVPGGPRRRLGHERDAAGPVDVRGGLVDVQGRRQDTVADGLHHLDHPGDAGGGLRVADVGLHGSEQERTPVPPGRAVGVEQRLRLDGVAEHGSGAVALDRVHLVRCQARVRQRLGDHALLGRAVGRGEPVRRAVLVDR